MKIKRAINGVERSFVLTMQEMVDVYLAMERRFDREDVLNYLDEWDDPEDFKAAFGVSVDAVKSKIDDVTTAKRKIVEETTPWVGPVEGAIRRVFMWRE